MNRKLPAILLASSLALSLAACGGPAEEPAASDGNAASDEVLTVAATTYPVYQLADMVIGDLDGIELKLVINQQVSCLHDYTLTVNDMRSIESADVLLISGAGFESFMADTLSASTAPVIDCSEGIELLPMTEHHHHDGEEEEEHDHDHDHDPHIWLDPWRAMEMMENIASGMAEASDLYSIEDYHANMEEPCAALEESAEAWKDKFDALDESQRNLITFHNGFAYLADAFDLTILKSIEEEAGSEASAKDISGIVSLVQEHHIPTIFTEKNGSDATAKAIQRESGVAVSTISMMMSDDGQSYQQDMEENLSTIYNGLTADAQ